MEVEVEVELMMLRKGLRKKRDSLLYVGQRW
jgi:hypothetical protein